MRAIKALLAGTIFFVAAQVYGQDVTFKVLVNKGKNELKTKDGWQPVKIGASLRSADEVKVAENAYLGLVHSSGKALEVKQSGRYKVTELAARVNGGTSVLNKYTDFILSANTTPKNNLAATGAVNRGVDNINVNLPLPESAVVYNNKVKFDWEEDNKALRPYSVVFKSMFGDELTVVEAKENMVEIDLGDRNFENEDNIIVTVLSKGNKSKLSTDYTLKKLSNADKARIKGLLQEIASQTNEETALNKLVVAGFYENNNLLIDASSAYLEAIRLEPDVPMYRESYNAFLLRHKIKTVPVKK